MGDPRQFEALARFLRTTCPAATAVAAVAAGQGELASWLARLLASLGLLLTLFVGGWAHASAQERHGPPGAGDAPPPEMRRWLRAFARAWATGDGAALMPFFAADAVVELGHHGPVGADAYTYAGSGVFSLSSGVRSLMAHGAQIALDGSAVSGANVTWTYRLVSTLPGVPPEQGRDDLTVVDGKIRRYRRTPDAAVVATRTAAIAAFEHAQATRAAQRAPAAALVEHERPGAPQRRTVPSVGPWIVAVGLSLLAVLGLAVVSRPGPPPDLPADRAPGSAGRTPRGRKRQP